MTESSLNESILNIRTFYGYLEHIIDSIESNNYHEPTINKLSDMVRQYYNEINAGDDEELYADDMQVECGDGDSIEEFEYGDENITNTNGLSRFTNSDSDSESDTSDEEESDDDSDQDEKEDEDKENSTEESAETKTSQNSATKEKIKRDEYLLNFIDTDMDDSKIELYNNEFYKNRLNYFVENYTVY